MHGRSETMKLNIAKKILCLSFCLSLTTIFAQDTQATTPNQTSDKTKSVELIIEQITPDNTEPVWQQARDLAELGNDVKDILESKLEKANTGQKIALAYALLANGWQREGSLALENIIRDTKAPLQRRIDAAAVLGKFGGEYVKARLRSVLRQEGLPENLKIELAKSLWKLSYDSSASDMLVLIANTGKSASARNKAALALARFGRFDQIRPILQDLSKTPGRDGDEARALLILDKKNTSNVGRDKFAEELVGEIVKMIRSSYAYDNTDPNEAEQIKSKNLASAAARALVRSLDDFNDYLDEEDYQEMLNSMHGDYGGIGAYVGMREGLFTILTPMWGKPAYKAGLKSMDIITKIDGDDITKLDLSKTVKKLKGKPGTPVKVTVIRKGFKEPKDYVIMRDLITMPMIFTQRLPGDIGYIRLTGFQEDPYRRISTSSELKKALNKFKKKGEVRGIILDLRNNPGGLLSEAVSVCENFLERNKLIVYSKGKISRRRNYTSRILGKPTYTGPLVVLINGGSASASEIVSGALRDHKRATLVGQKSFGKGSVQMLLPVKTTNGNTRLKLTIAKYYLPSGECIHGRDKGIKPHLDIEERKLEGVARDLRLKEIENRDIAIWLEEKFDANKDKFMALLEFDNNDPQAYPEFDELYALINKKYPELKVDKQILRQELRSTLFAFLRESRGIMNYPVDIMSSDVLQRGLAVIGEKTGGLPDIAIYNSFKDKWKDQKLAKKDDKEPAKESK